MEKQARWMKWRNWRKLQTLLWIVRTFLVSPWKTLLFRIKRFIDFMTITLRLYSTFKNLFCFAKKHRRFIQVTSDKKKFRFNQRSVFLWVGKGTEKSMMIFRGNGMRIHPQFLRTKKFTIRNCEGEGAKRWTLKSAWKIQFHGKKVKWLKTERNLPILVKRGNQKMQLIIENILWQLAGDFLSFVMANQLSSFFFFTSNEEISFQIICIRNSITSWTKSSFANAIRWE